MARRKTKTTSDIPRKRKHVRPTHSPSSISIGTPERDLLRYLHKTNNKRFNVRNYSINIAQIPRSTVYDYLNKLQRLGLVNRALANNTITEKGIIFLESQEGGNNEWGVGGSRRVCRDKSKLSTHFHKFKLPISDKTNFNQYLLRKLNPIQVRENKLHNLHQTIVYFEDATILVNPKQLIINLYDVITDNLEDSDLKCLNKVIDYAKKFMEVGVKTEGILIEEEGHWARVNSVLSELLGEKFDGKYFLDLGEGKKFWIDHSYPHKSEDETNDKIVRERVDRMLREVSNTDISLLDIDKITKSLGFISKLESARLLNEIDLRKPMENRLEEKQRELSYVG